NVFKHDKRLRFLLGDVRDKQRLLMAMEEIDIVYHIAAIKHVPISEYNPFEAVKTNVIGTQNAVECALESGVKTFVGISTDKAAEPINVMGATKLLGEKIITAATFYKGNKITKFSSVRFGNVLGSRGSVVPLFIEQIKTDGPVTVTDPEMTRFFMTIPDAAGLIFKATELTQGGEVFILKMPTMRLGDLVEVLIEEYAPKFGYKPGNIKIKYLKSRPGEKFYEILLSESEAKFTLETEEMFIILPHPEYNAVLDIDIKKYGKANKVKVTKYSSEGKGLSKKEIRELIKKMNLNL
ncbi:MAG: polysaccharide biosynthesis protein, partial [bacterium]|nr:polysaccharide biosynthesis protein [bacterium]